MIVSREYNESKISEVECVELGEYPMSFRRQPKYKYSSNRPTVGYFAIHHMDDTVNKRQMNPHYLQHVKQYDAWELSIT